MRLSFRLTFLPAPAFCVVALITTAASGQTPQLDHFENHVRPVLVKHCQKCHGSKKAESGLRVDAGELLLKGGDSGASVVPGKPEESLLWQAINHDGFEMPPEQKLPDEAIEAIGKWIRDGAVWPEEEAVTPALGDQEYIGRQAQDHWAFQPITRPSLPQSDEANDIDKFIAAKLSSEGLSLNRPADRRTLNRRLYYDLTGLPPEADAKTPQDWASLVDQVLSSPHFGEHWGRHWLDIARYADTRDWYARGDLNYPFAWTYRDYVVRSFNENLPFDDFIRQQLAADHYSDSPGDPTRAALGFLTVGSRFRNRQHEQIADYIDVVSRGLLGLTVACARCHDHKYDPIPTADYYSLHGIFASSAIPGDFPTLDNVERPAELVKAYEDEKAKRTAKFHEFLTELKTVGLKDVHGRWPDYLNAYHEVNIDRKESLVNSAKLRQLKSRAAGAMFTRLNKLRGDKKWQKHPFFGPWARLISLKPAAFKRTKAAIAKNQADKLAPEMLGLLQNESIASAGELTQRVAEIIQRAMDADKHPELADVRELALSDDGPFSFSIMDLEKQPETVGAERGKFDKAKAPIVQLEIDHPGAPPRAMVMLDGRTRDSYIHIRGEAGRRGDTVPRRFLTLLQTTNPDTTSPESTSVLSAEFAEGSGRRQLAEAIVHPDNPLTARVIVNWVWRHYFGRGFIRANDFGLRTKAPAHQELLDFLAAQLIANDWDLRWLHREILTSKTYQQSSQIPAQTATADPANDLFGHQTRRRLSYEAMRDSMLLVSGRLDRTMYGRPVAPEVNARVDQKRRAQALPTAKLTPETKVRRALYHKIDRVDFDATRATFDFPRPDNATIARLETTVPQQMLFALNSPFVLSCAKAITNATSFEDCATKDDRIEWLYHQILKRSPTAAERNAVSSFIPVVSTKPVKAAWQWGYGTGDSENGDTQFQPLPHSTGSSFQFSETFPDKRFGHLRLTRTGGHPGRNRQMATIVRWTSPVDAEIRIQGRLVHPSENGDGVQAKTIHQKKVIGEWSAAKATVPTPISRHRVKVGDTIDFVVECGPGGSSHDSYQWNQVITILKSLSQDERFPQGYSWNARDEFGQKPPQPLDAWELAAQSLLVSNEFFFVD